MARPGTQHRRQRLPGAVGAVIDERQHRMKPVSPFEVRRRTFLLRVRPDQGGVQIDDHLTSRSDRATPPPDRRSRGGPCPPDRSDRRARVSTERIDEPADRGIGGHRAEQLRLSPHQRRIRQTVTTERDRQGQIQHRFARIVDRPPRTPRRQLPRQPLRQAADLRSLRQKRRAGRGNQRLTTRFDPKPTTTATLHLRSAFPLAEHGP